MIVFVTAIGLLALPFICASDGIACMEDCLKSDDPEWEDSLQNFRAGVYGSEESRARRSADESPLNGHHMQKRDADLTNSSCGDLLVPLCWTSCKNNPMQAVVRQRMEIQLKYCNPSESQDVLDKFWSDWDIAYNDLRAFNSHCSRRAYLTHAKDPAISHCSIDTRCLMNAVDFMKQKYANKDAIILLGSSTKLLNSLYFNRETPQTCPELYEPYQP